MNMERLTETLIRHEGLRLEPYRCTEGKLTIGVGHNLDDNPISKRAAMLILEDDIAHCLVDLRNNISGFIYMPPIVQEVLVNLCFNMGINRLLGFKKTLGHLREGNYPAAADELLDSRYARQVGRRANELADTLRGVDND